MAAHQAPLIPGILQARTLEWVAISFTNAWKWKVKGTSLSRVRLLCSPCEPMDYSLPGSSVHGIFQARVLEWVAIAFSAMCSKHPYILELTSLLVMCSSDGFVAQSWFKTFASYSNSWSCFYCDILVRFSCQCQVDCVKKQWWVWWLIVFVNLNRLCCPVVWQMLL